MTNKMPTVEEIRAMVSELQEYPRSGEARHDAVQMLLTIADHLSKSETTPPFYFQRYVDGKRMA